MSVPGEPAHEVVFSRNVASQRVDAASRHDIPIRTGMLDRDAPLGPVQSRTFRGDADG
jgi:hypothetical protein